MFDDAHDNALGSLPKRNVNSSLVNTPQHPSWGMKEMCRFSLLGGVKASFRHSLYALLTSPLPDELVRTLPQRRHRDLGLERHTLLDGRCLDLMVVLDRIVRP